MPSAAPTYCYRVDGTDRLVWLDPWWLAFAQENGAPNLIAARVIGRPLWDFIADRMTRALYQEIHARIRSTHQSAVIPMRCDSPTLKRYMRLRILPGDAGQLNYECSLIRAEPTSLLKMLDPSVARSSAQVTMCSGCKRCLIETHGWLEPESVMCLAQALQHQAPPALRYAICPACADILSKSPANGNAA